jgi:hypothetical protein
MCCKQSLPQGQAVREWIVKNVKATDKDQMKRGLKDF